MIIRWSHAVGAEMRSNKASLPGIYDVHPTRNASLRAADAGVRRTITTETA